jgi:hypothetical protein
MSLDRTPELPSSNNLPNPTNPLPFSMVSPPSQSLIQPQEILDAIIDNLFDDRDSLLACSLVAKPFIPATRYHLFTKTTVRLDRLGGLGTLRSATYSTVSGSIHHLTIAIDERTSKNEDAVQTYARDVEKFDVTGIRHLGVSYSTFSAYSRYIHSEALGHVIFQSVSTLVTHLTICDATFNTISAMQSLVCAFTSLSILKLCRLIFAQRTIVDFNTPLTPEITLSPSLEQFSVWGDSHGDVLNWVVGHNPVPLVHTAFFERMPHLSLPLVNRYLCAAGPSIKQLTLGVVEDSSSTFSLSII